METFEVYSKILDENIKKDVVNSPIWKECYHPEEIDPDEDFYCYTIKFDGVKPVQCTKYKKI